MLFAKVGVVLLAKVLQSIGRVLGQQSERLGTLGKAVRSLDELPARGAGIQHHQSVFVALTASEAHVQVHQSRTKELEGLGKRPVDGQ